MKVRVGERARREQGEQRETERNNTRVSERESLLSPNVLMV